MNWNEMRKKTLTIALMVVFAVGAGLAASATAQAQYRDYDRYGRNDRGRWEKDRTKDYGLIYGYLRGYPDGWRALRNGYRVNHKDVANYRNDSQGWLSWMDHRDTYRDAYRKGFELGFKEAQANRQPRYNRTHLERVLGTSIRNAYGRDDFVDDYWDDRRGNGRWNDRYDDRNRRYDRNEVYRIAQQNGYREGFRHGSQDRARRQRYDYDDSREYRSALTGYRSEYGNRSAYQQAFRDGYRRGYDEAYRRGNNRGGWPF